MLPGSDVDGCRSMLETGPSLVLALYKGSLDLSMGTTCKSQTSHVPTIPAPSRFLRAYKEN